MRNWNALGLVALVLTACSFHASVGGGGGSAGPSRGSAPPPRPASAPAPAPAPAPPPPAPAHAAMGQTGRKAATQAPAPAPHQVAPAGKGSLHMVDVLNLVKIREHIAKNPKGCGFTEVAPGQWIKIDCHAYQPATKSIAHLSTRKAKLVSAKRAQWRPLRMGNVFMRRAATVTVKPGIGATAKPGERAVGDNGGSGGQSESLPGTVDHRADNLEGPVKDQGPVGACTAFSLSSAIDNAAIRAGKLAAGSREQAASPNHVWSGYGIPQMGTAADASLARSIATTQLWPQNAKENCKLADPIYEMECGFDTNVVAGSWRQDPALVAKYDQANASPTYKISHIERLQTLPPNTDELVQALASGSSLWIAMKIDGLAWSNKSMKNAVIPDWNQIGGGHAIEMAGYRETPGGRQYLIHNSWGTSWGDGGYAWVSEAMIVKYMHYAYKVKIEGGVKKEDLTDDDCAPDELLDISTGLCALICSGDVRPDNGCR